MLYQFPTLVVPNVDAPLTDPVDVPVPYENEKPCTIPPSPPDGIIVPIVAPPADTPPFMVTVVVDPGSAGAPPETVAACTPDDIIRIAAQEIPAAPLHSAAWLDLILSILILQLTREP